MIGVKTMPTLRSKVMVKATLTKAPALSRTKVRTRETQGKQKAEGFELKVTATKQKKVSNISLSEEDLEEVRGLLEEKGEELDRTIKKKRDWNFIRQKQS